MVSPSHFAHMFHLKDRRNLRRDKGKPRSMWFQVSAVSLCLMAVVAVTSALPTSTSDIIQTEQTPISDRRIFKHKKPLLKHKKFGGWLPHIFAKTEYRGIPTPIYKVHRYHGLEVKPVSSEEVSFLTSGPVVESHSVVPVTSEFVPIHHVQQQILPPAPPAFDHLSYPVPFLPTPLPSPAPSFTFFQAGPLNAHLPAAFPHPPVPVPNAVVPDVHSFAHQTVAVSTTPAPPVAVAAPSPVTPHLPPLTLPHPFSSLPLALPSPPPLQVFSSTPAPLLSAVPEHEYPDHDVGEEVEAVPQPGLLQKIKGWKIGKVKSALSHLHKAKPFKHSVPAVSLPEKIPEAPVVHLQPPAVVAVEPALQFPLEPIHPPSFHPPQVFFSSVTPSPAPFFPVNYESFPPYPTPVPQQLFNSYGTPIPHDSYAPPHFSHDRVSAATEEKSSVLPAPPSFTERSLPQQTTSRPEQPKQVDQQQESSQIDQNFQEVVPQVSQSDLHPVYKPEQGETGEKEKTFEEARNENQEDAYPSEQIENGDANNQNHSNHQEE